MYMSLNEDDGVVQWFLYVSAGFATVFFVAEVIRTCQFRSKRANSQKSTPVEEEKTNLVEENEVTEELSAPTAKYYTK